MPKNDGVFKVQFHIANLAIKMPKWATLMPKWETKMLKLATCRLIFVAKKWCFYRQNNFIGVLSPMKKCRRFGFMILTPDRPWGMPMYSVHQQATRCMLWILKTGALNWLNPPSHNCVTSFMNVQSTSLTQNFFRIRVWWKV